MNYVLAVFRSRTQTFEFIDRMRARGFSAQAMNTPAEAHIGCGICAVFPAVYLPQARAAINAAGYGSFKGFFRYEKRGIRTVVERLI